MAVFRPMRRKRQQLSDEESEAILKKGTSGVLALLGDEGYPYAVPLSYVYVVSMEHGVDSSGITHKFRQQRLIFHSAVSGHKVDAIRSCPLASFCVVEQDVVSEEHFTTFFRSVIAFGRIRILDDEKEKLAAIRLLAARYSPHEPQDHVDHEISKSFPHLLMFELQIEHLTGKQAIELVGKA